MKLEDVLARVRQLDEQAQQGEWFRGDLRLVNEAYALLPRLAKAMEILAGQAREHVAGETCDDGDGGTFTACAACFIEWPCDTAEALAAIEQALAEPRRGHEA